MQPPATLSCGDTSGGTSYQQFRLVFCHYPQLIGTNCISEPFQTSTLLSKRFILARDRSTAFGSQACDFTPLSDVAPRRSCALVAFATPPQMLRLATDLNSSARVSRRNGRLRSSRFVLTPRGAFLHRESTLLSHPRLLPCSFRNFSLSDFEYFSTFTHVTSALSVWGSI